VRSVGGFDTTVWIVVGLLAYFVFERVSTQTTNAISGNRSLFAYRQVLPIDAMLTRAVLELVVLAVVAMVVFGAAALLGHNVLPSDPLEALTAIAALWLLAIGWGQMRAVFQDLVPEIEIVLNFVMKPMYLISGVIVPLASIPLPYRDWLMYNPVAQGIEATREAFAANYHAASGLSVPYLVSCTLVLLFVGMVLMRQFSARLVTA
jgi:capsular polysaccharide transport system permease protein